MTVRLILTLALVAGLVACDAVGGLVPRTLSSEVVAAIEAQGFEVVPTDPPVGVIAPGAALTAARDPGNPPGGPFFVLLTCPAGRECQSWSGWMPRQPAGAWVVTFPGRVRADGGRSEPWSLWQADTGDYVTGFEPSAAPGPQGVPPVSAAPLP